MANIVCPWWLGPSLAIPFRRLFHKPQQILGPYLAAGMTVFEPGPGMGYFTLDLARLVGQAGRVVAVDIQPEMLDGLRRRAEKAGVAERIDARLAQGADMPIDDLAQQVDFALAFYMVHELPDAPRFFGDVRRMLKQTGKLLLVEPKFHVTEADFAVTLRHAQAAGLRIDGHPVVAWSRTALLY